MPNKALFNGPALKPAPSPYGVLEPPFIRPNGANKQWYSANEATHRSTMQLQLHPVIKAAVLAEIYFENWDVNSNYTTCCNKDYVNIFAPTIIC